MDIRNRHFGGRNEKEIWLRDTKQVFFQLRELAGSRHGVTIHQEGRQNLPIAMSLCVQIEHKIDQDPFEAGTGIHVESEARTGYLGCAGEIENPELFTDIPVILRRGSRTGAYPPSGGLPLFFAALPPTGTLGSGRFGMVNMTFSKRDSISGSGLLPFANHLG